MLNFLLNTNLTQSKPSIMKQRIFTFYKAIMKNSFKYLLLCCSVLLLTCRIYAQDLIYLKTGDVIESKILSIDQSKISYKKWNYIDGPTFSVYKSSVEKVTYQNGDTEDFQKDYRPDDYMDSGKKNKKNPEPFRNIIGWRPFTPIYRSLGLSYERMLKKNFGLGLPVVLNFDGYYRVGVDVKYYVSTQYNRKTGRSEYALYIGPSVRTGTIGNLIEGGLDYYSSGYSLSQKTSLMVTLGGYYYLINNIGLEINFGSGAMVDDYEIVPAISGSISILCGF